MLKINHLTKIYKTKGGNAVKALDDVSIDFGETGLVFLLGKSGSGKSTLLNLAGGLDAPTEGEIVVMGKSSRDFTESDFDSYRNTFVGFVFQEYNVLNEFSVEDNVALALELQGKPKDKRKIAEILQSVELEPFAKRKPNTLSGGQKQRIAIARALVKDPQIIMADEPTGALDSVTGKQVFDTLKALSENRLVIVVSHDREFAEIYGDRIVELSDGKIVSDVTKRKLTPEKLDENVTLIGDNTLSVKCGNGLSEENFSVIRKFLSESNGNVLLTKGEKEIADFKRAARMDDDGARERFEKTDESVLAAKTYDKDETKFIRSRLPAAKAIKIGASGLRLKPFRLVLTVLLSVVAFVMFGLFSTMMVYDNDEVLMNTFMESDYEYLAMNKYYNVRVTTHYGDEPYTYDYSRVANFTPAELESISAVAGDAFGTYSITLGNLSNAAIKSDSSDYYRPIIEKIAVIGEGHPFDSKLKVGTFPQAENEICVSSYFLDCMKHAEFRVIDEDGAMGGTTPTEIETEADLVGKYLAFYDNVFRVSGIFDSGIIPEKYDTVKQGDANFITENSYMLYLHEAPHSMAFVSQSYIDKNADRLNTNSEYKSYFEYAGKQIVITKGDDEYVFKTYGIKVHSPDNEDVFPITYFGAKKQTLANNELIVPLDAIGQLLPYPPQYEDYFTDDMTEEEQLAASERFNAATAECQRVWDSYDIILHNRVFLYEPDKDGNIVQTEREATPAEKEAATNTLKTYFTQHTESLSVDVKLNEYEYIGQFRIVGFYLVTNDYYEYGVYCGRSLYDQADVAQNMETVETNYKQEADAVYGSVYVPLTKERAAFGKILDLIGAENGNPETDVFYELDNVLYSSVELVNDTVDTLSTVFLVVGIVLAVFASLLLFNFISMSISNKKKEIGILRAVGARGVDVFKIFFSESGIIVGICTILSLIGSVVLTGVINNILKAEVGLDVTLFVFGWVSVVMMIGVALAVAFVATFLPVFFASRKKPVESIRSL